MLYVKSNGNYCDLCRTDGGIMQNLPVSLGQMAEQIRTSLADPATPSFIQLGRQYIVNAEHILSVYPKKKILVFEPSGVNVQAGPSISPSSASLSALIEWLTRRISCGSCSVLVEESVLPMAVREDDMLVLNHS